MTSQVGRRRFLQTAGAGLAAGLASTACATAQAAENSPSEIPIPDADTVAPATEPTSQTPCCDPASTLIFACSGAADVGEVADHAARKLSREGAGKMYCLAGVGGRVEGILKNTKAAEAILVLDGCPLHCARNTLEQAGVTKYIHLCLSDLGMPKGQTPATEEATAIVAAQGKKSLGQ